MWCRIHIVAAARFPPKLEHARLPTVHLVNPEIIVRVRGHRLNVTKAISVTKEAILLALKTTKGVESARLEITAHEAHMWSV